MIIRHVPSWGKNVSLSVAALAMITMVMALNMRAVRAIKPPCYPDCPSYSIDYNTLQTTADGLTANIEYYGPANIIVRPFACTGSNAVCPVLSMLDPQTWTSLGGTEEVTTYPVTYNQLRSGRTYQNVYLGAMAGSTIATARKVSVGSITTWPGYSFTPTDADAGCGGGVCSRDISWTTPFPGDSKVVYGVNPPVWANSYTDSNPSVFFQASVALPTKEAWGVGINGTIIYRNALGAWSTLSNPDSLMRRLNSIDMTDNQHGWIVGASGLTLKTSNGQTWTIINPPAGFSSSLLVVIAPTQQTAWAFGDSESILKYNATTDTWSQQLFSGRDTGQAIRSAASVDGKLIIAGSTNGRIIRTTDGGTNWAVSSIDGSSETVSTMTTLDGTTFWAGGSSGSLWKSSDSGSSWILVRSLSSTILSLVLQSPTNLQFISGNSVYNYNSLTNSLVQDSTVVTQLGANPYTLANITPGRYVAMGSSRVVEYRMPVGSTSYTDSAVTTNHTIRLSDIIPNTPYYYAVESTGAGVTTGAFGGPFTSIIDAIPPTITMDPVPRYINASQAPLTITGNSADTPPGTVQSVRVLVGGFFPLTVTGTTNWSAVIPTAQLSAGPTLSIEATSYDGTNRSDPAMADVSYDTVAPTVTLNLPATTNTAAVTASGTATDASPIATLEQKIDLGVWTVISSPNVTPAPYTSNLILTVGSHDVTVRATDAAGNQAVSPTRTILYTAPDFAMAALTPTSQTKVAGQSATYSIRAAAVGGFTGIVNLSASVPPTAVGVTASYAPPGSITLTSSTTSDDIVLTVNTTAGPASGPHTITVTGTSGTLPSKSVTVQLTLTATPIPPDFTLTCSGSCTKTVATGGTVSYVMNIIGDADYVYNATTHPFVWSTGVLPTGATASFGPFSGNPSASGTGTLTLTINTTTAIAPGTNITVQANDGNNSHTVTINLDPAPDFTISVGTVNPNVAAGSGVPAIYNLILTSVNNFTYPVKLSLVPTPNDPTNIVPTFGQVNVTPTSTGASVTMNVIVNSAFQTPGSVALDIHADFAPNASLPTAINRVAAATMIVAPDVTAPTITNESVSVSDHDATISWETNEPADSMVIIYSDSAQTAQVNLTSDHLTFCTSACHSRTTGTLNSSTTYYYTITSVDQAYPTPNSTTKKVDDSPAHAVLSFRTTAAPDNTPPTIDITQPRAGRIDGAVDVIAIGSDDNPMDHLQLQIRLNSATPVTIIDTSYPCASTTSCQLNYRWNTLASDSPNGSYTITATAISTTGPAFSATTSILVNVDNDRSPPVLKCLVESPGCEPRPEATDLSCSDGTCSITIHWITDKPSTSEVEYGRAVNCAASNQRTLPDGTIIPCTYEPYPPSGNPSNYSPPATDHNVRLIDLLPNELYHYRITSCSSNNYCTN